MDLKWDGTISMTTLFTGLGIIWAIFKAVSLFATKVIARIDVAEVKFSDLQKDVSEMKPVVVQIHALVAADGAKQRQLDDHAERLRNLERTAK